MRLGVEIDSERDLDLDFFVFLSHQKKEGRSGS